MSLLVALSTHQSRTQDAALDALWPHLDDGAVDGIQLTPGNLPSPGFGDRVATLAADGYEIRVHHGFAWDRYRRAVYDSAGNPRGIGADHSVHPPRDADPGSTPPGPGAGQRRRRGLDRAGSLTGRRPAPSSTWDGWLPVAVANDLVVETMYPGYLLGSGRQIEQAMEAGLRLCVDVAHLDIQRRAGVLDDPTTTRLLHYDRVVEVHVSRSVDGRDTHAPLTPGTWGLGWARDQRERVPVVVESYWHHTPPADQRSQLALLAAPTRHPW